MRVGIGFDAHSFCDDPGRVLVLGGVKIPGERPLAGHSDADVIAHAVSDALLGASGLGELGEMFPAGDPAWAGADSMTLLARVVAALAENGWEVLNVDCAVVLEAPKLSPLRAIMTERLSAVVGSPVTVKPKHAEGLGALGRAEGVAAWAVALVRAI